MDDLAAKLHEAEMVKSKWIPITNLTFDDLPQQRSQLKSYNQMYVAPVSRDVIHVNEIAARLTGRNVPLSHGNLKSLEEVTTRARLLRIAIDERTRELNQIQHDHGTIQQHFLTEAVDEPWERAVTNNKLPCYINRQTETVHLLSPRYMQIINSMNEFNEVRYAAYRTAMKLRRLQIQLGLNHVNLNNLVNAFEQHGLGPNGHKSSKNSKSDSNSTNNSSNDKAKQESTTSNNKNPEDVINDDLPYELRLIAVPDIVSCLKKIFETAEIERQQQKQERKSSSSGKKQSSKDKENSKTMANNNDDLKESAINVPLSVDLCLNWLLDLYDAPSRAGFIRQFSFQVALVLLSHISLEQKYIYLFNLISDENQRADERRFGLLIYDCLRLPKLLGEVAAFGGTNVEPSVRSCLEMAAASELRQPNGTTGITIDQVLAWIRAEPQSLVWLVVLHRLRLAESSRHPAKCNSCRKYPIQGFRYRCLKCFNFDLCQYCFLSDKSVKKHKPS
ncbi:EF-hand and zinc finger domain containing protein [Euroglyphus maynei]|uniref:EF-hand and zinc finger domain containing protein n=1 Tax=Euroglyphus maynei TaxID=6958 RepID=A0A1Y3BDQ8_EURMA|nr:EF-hand and zinc finger domain containing protein [Euroglyphus maynei]